MGKLFIEETFAASTEILVKDLALGVYLFS